MVSDDAIGRTGRGNAAVPSELVQGMRRMLAEAAEIERLGKKENGEGGDGVDEEGEEKGKGKEKEQSITREALEAYDQSTVEKEDCCAGMMPESARKWFLPILVEDVPLYRRKNDERHNQLTAWQWYRDIKEEVDEDRLAWTIDGYAQLLIENTLKTNAPQLKGRDVDFQRMAQDFYQDMIEEVRADERSAHEAVQMKMKRLGLGREESRGSDKSCELTARITGLGTSARAPTIIRGFGTSPNFSSSLSLHCGRPSTASRVCIQDACGNWTMGPGLRICQTCSKEWRMDEKLGMPVRREKVAVNDEEEIEARYF